MLTDTWSVREKSCVHYLNQTEVERMEMVGNKDVPIIRETSFQTCATSKALSRSFQGKKSTLLRVKMYNNNKDFYLLCLIK